MAEGHRFLCEALTEKDREWLAAWDTAHLGWLTVPDEIKITGGGEAWLPKPDPPRIRAPGCTA
jgi:hypothetical protein